MSIFFGRLNPHSLVQNMITGKPNVDPARMGYKVSADPDIVGERTPFAPRLPSAEHSGRAAAELDTVLKETKKVPKDKYPEPVTSSQQIGWYSTPLVRLTGDIP